MYLVTQNQMQEIDKFTIKKIGIPSLVLMENAGKKVFEFICNLPHNRNFLNNKICVLAGIGNNGGDGLVVSRHLQNNGYNPTTIIIGSQKNFKNDFLTNYNILKKFNSKIVILDELSKTTYLNEYLKNSNLIIDAIFGTGLNREIEGLTKDVIKLVNTYNKKVISIDIPSGVHADTGDMLGCAIQANWTITLCLPKQGLFLFPGAEYAGKIIVTDISIPYSQKLINKINTNILLWNDAKTLIPKRPRNAHKGNFGKILIIAGSKNYVGAPALTSSAALKTGSGLVFVGIPESLYSSAAKKFVEQIPFPLSETDIGTISKSAYDSIIEKIKSNKIDCIAIGPGLGIHPETIELVKKLIETIDIPCVLDADGINAVAKDLKILNRSKSKIVITPHSGEFARLINIEADKIEKNRINITQNFINKNKMILVLKGAHTLIGYEKNIYMNLTGNSGMATAGSGDVLTGIITSLIGQGLVPSDAAKLGVFLHGRAGDIAKFKKNEMSIMASDLINNIPNAIKELMNYTYKQNKSYELENIQEIPEYFNT